MKNIIILPLALSLAAVALIEPVFAGVIPTHDIQITENSSTSLSATYDGSAVTRSFNCGATSPAPNVSVGIKMQIIKVTD
jgi:hypothetical protein